MSLFNSLVAKTIMHVPGPLVGFFARSYIAGATRNDAVRVTRELNGRGMMATIDVLGEFVSRKEEATAFKEEGLAILQTIKSEGLDANLSLKPTQMGLLLDPDFAFANIREIVARARELANFVRIDMEDSSTTAATLDFYRRLRTEFPGHVGVVLQACLRRTSADIDALADQPLNIRLCKGIYREPRHTAYQDPATINRNYVYCLDKILAQKGYAGIATHDEKLVFEALSLIDKYGLQPAEYEFQMLLGIDEELRRIIIAAGHRLRIYVPYGAAWLPYSRRRLRENPAIARHVLRQLFGLKPGG